MEFWAKTPPGTREAIRSNVRIRHPFMDGLPRWTAPDSIWQTTLIGRQEIWPVHQKTADLGGMLRTGLEDTFYLPDGSRAAGNGVLIEALADCARRAGRSIASPAEARALLGLGH